MTRQLHTPETAAACQMLYAAADEASITGRGSIFRAIAYLTGRPVSHIVKTWKETR